MEKEVMEFLVDKIVVEKEGKYVKLNFFEDFNEIEDYLAIIEKLEALSEKYTTIIVDINSEGGYLRTLTHLVNVIKKYKFVVTINSSVALSAGFILWCLGDIRLAYPYSEFMWHRESWSIFGKTNNQKRYVEHNNYIYEIFIKDIVKDVLTKEQLELGEETEVYFLGEQLIKEGVAIDATNFNLDEILFLDNTYTCVVDDSCIAIKDGDLFYVFPKTTTPEILPFKDAVKYLLHKKNS